MTSDRIDPRVADGVPEGYVGTLARLIEPGQKWRSRDWPDHFTDDDEPPGDEYAADHFVYARVPEPPTVTVDAETLMRVSHAAWLSASGDLEQAAERLNEQANAALADPAPVTRQEGEG